jgi:NAD(P)-dependent dehydrogenase (short-subunit alcohol dehydrogenase family)
LTADASPATLRSTQGSSWTRRFVIDSFVGRTAVVTGGASGIGRALALAFAREGARVVLGDVDEAGLADTVGAIHAKGGEGIAVATDVSDLAQVKALADRAFAAFGKVHVVCNNAGVAVWGGLEQATHRDWQWVLGINLWGVIHGVEAFVPRMIAQKEPGHILNTASMAGLIASQGLGVYNTSKYAVVGLSETLAKDLRPYGIGVSVLCPMAVDTRINVSERNRPAALVNDVSSRGAPVTLMGRTLAPEAVAEMALAAIRDNRLYVITHHEGLEPLRRRFSRMEQAVVEGKP